MPDQGRPERPAYFAIRLGQLLASSPARYELGIAAMHLLRCIADLWDEQRYVGPVCVGTVELASRTTLPVSTLKRERSRLVTLGWLDYEPDAKARPGLYRVNIPAASSPIPARIVDQIPATCEPQSEIVSRAEPESERPSTIPAQIVSRAEPESEPESGIVDQIPATCEPQSDAFGGDYRGGASHPLCLNVLVPTGGVSDAREGAGGTATPKPAETPPTPPAENLETFDPWKKEAEDRAEFVARWNAAGLPPIRRLNPTLQSRLKAALQDADWAAEYPAALERLSRSEFLRRGVNRQCGPLDPLEFLTDLDLTRRILAGRYDDRPLPTRSRDSPRKMTGAEYAQIRLAEMQAEQAAKSQ